MEKIAVFGGTFNPVHCGHLRLAETAQKQFQLNRVIWVPASQPPHKLPQNQFAQGLQAPLNSALGLDSDLDFQHRLEMVRLAVRPYPQFEVAVLTLQPIEKSPEKSAERKPAARELTHRQSVNRQPGASYAVDTLKALQTTYPNRQWYWIIGLDAFQTLPRWRSRQLLAQDCRWLVAPRPPTQASSLDQANHPNKSGGQSSSPSPEASPEASPEKSLEESCLEVARQLATEQITLQWQLLAMPSVAISSSLIRQYRYEQRSIHGLVPDLVECYILAHNLYNHAG